jgi:hypothetical protein
MLEPDAVSGMGEDLSVQFKLALASPLWKGLPYGAQLNPSAWDIELIKLQPGQRLSVKISIPWRSGRQNKSPVHLVMHVWHNQKSPWAHQRLIRFNTILRQAERTHVRIPEPIFYDSLAHALVYPINQAKAPSPKRRPHPSDCWMRHFIHTFSNLSHV